MLVNILMTISQKSMSAKRESNNCDPGMVCDSTSQTMLTFFYL